MGLLAKDVLLENKYKSANPRSLLVSLVTPLMMRVRMTDLTQVKISPPETGKTLK